MVDIFISYAWSEARNEWVRLLAAHLKLLGFSIAFDRDLVYGAGLDAFMLNAGCARHVLLIVDERYVERADVVPDSGVARENEIVRHAMREHDDGWLAALVVDNPKFLLPSWLKDMRPKCFNFNGYENASCLDGLPEQINDLWRWIADLPLNSTAAISPELARIRVERIERIDLLRDPSSWASPGTSDSVKFEYSLAPQHSFTLGGAEYQTTFSVSACSKQAVYLYSDYCHAVGVAKSFNLSAREASDFIVPCRAVTLSVGDIGVLQNANGCLSLIHLSAVTEEAFDGRYTPSSIEFDYKILIE